MRESLEIILEQYKKENISKEEASKLIEDIYYKPTYYWTYPYYSTTTQWLNQKEMDPSKFTITCNANNKMP